MSFVITTTTGSSVTIEGDNDIRVVVTGEVVTLTITPKVTIVEAEVSAPTRCRPSEYDVECECAGCTLITGARQDFLRDERQEASQSPSWTRPWTCVRCESINSPQDTVCEVCDEVHSI